MPRVATVRLGWTRSPSADVSKVEVVVTVGATQTTTEVGPEVEAFQVEVSASTSFSFQVRVTDAEGLTATSELYSYTLGDLTAPVPPTGLFHEVIGVRDVPDPTPEPVA